MSPAEARLKVLLLGGRARGLWRKRTRQTSKCLNFP